MSGRGRLLVLACALLWLALGIVSVASAGASGGGGVVWSVTAIAKPTNLARGDGADEYLIVVTNVGDRASSGPVSIADVLPAGIVATEMSGFEAYDTNKVVGCVAAIADCVFGEPVDVGDSLIVTLSVAVGSAAPASAVNRVSVSGGGGPPASFEGAAAVGDAPVAPPFGIAPGSFTAGVSSALAGAHVNFTTAFGFSDERVNVPVGSLRNINVDLPPGLIGNPRSTPQCDAVPRPTCPPDTAVGVATILLTPFPGSHSVTANTVLIYNIRPYRGEPAAFAFNFNVVVRLDTSVRSNGDYGIHVTVPNINEAVQVIYSSITLWGVPADHNGPGTNGQKTIAGQSFGGPGSGMQAPFMDNPAVCGPRLPVSLSVESWAARDSQGVIGQPAVSTPPAALLPSLSGCDGLSFAPTLSVMPSTFRAGAPAGYTVDLGVPQNENPEGRATPPLKDATVTLPAGTVIDPSGADGLGACSEEQIGLHVLGGASCPPSAKIGEVEIHTPLLEEPLTGSVYLAQQSSNPFGSLLAMYLVVEGSGVRVKLAGEVHLDPATGQIQTSFSGTPQVSFDNLKLTFKGGNRAPLRNPTGCGTATTTSLLVPYGASPATPSSSFPVEGCPAPGTFAPGFLAGTQSNQAAAYSPFSVTLTRSDADQEFSQVSVKTPVGLLGIIKNVPLCPEPQANLGSCPEASLIGHTTAGAGAGTTPFYLAGKVFLTGPYGSGPFGLSIVVPAKAGPIDLGNVVVRASIAVDPATSQLTITTDPLPTIRDGVPLQIKTINVNIDRREFTFNPTSCDPTSIQGTIASTQGTTSTVSSRFQAAGCQGLPFKPVFTASTSGKTSGANGASLHVHVGYPQGAQANIRSVSVVLPKRLPARLTTIQQACRDSTFNQNPAACPPGSLIGVGVASTPVLAAQITGPAYLVSHGGASFPDIVVILQAQGIRIDLTGSINITKQGITSSTFANVPDVPIASFDLILPEGPHSGLGATTSLCTGTLTMPTTITAQNGTQIKQATKVQVNGCPRKKPKPKKKKK